MHLLTPKVFITYQNLITIVYNNVIIGDTTNLYNKEKAMFFCRQNFNKHNTWDDLNLSLSMKIKFHGLTKLTIAMP